MVTPYKTAEQKYLFETYADDVDYISQATVRRIADLLSDTVWVRPENRRDFAASATHAEKTFLAHLIEAGVRAVLRGLPKSSAIKRNWIIYTKCARTLKISGWRTPKQYKHKIKKFPKTLDFSFEMHYNISVR